MAHDLLKAETKDKAIENSLGNRLKILADRLDSALGGNKQLEL